MAGQGEVCSLPPGVDRGVQVRVIPSPREPGAQGVAQVRQVRGEARVAGRGEVCGLLGGVDRGVQVRVIPGPLKPGAQGDAQVR